MTYNTPLRPKKIITKEKINNYALKYLSKFNTTYGYLQDFLYKKIKTYHLVPDDFDVKANIAEVLEGFKELGYINDDLFAESRIKGLLKEGHPIFLIAGKLIQKNIAQDTITKAIGNIVEFNSQGNLADLEVFAALKYARKRSFTPPSLNEPLPENIYKKHLQILLRKGFKLDIAERALKGFSSREEISNYLIDTERDYNL